MDIPWRTQKRAAQPVPPAAPVRKPCFARRRTSGGVEEAPKLVYAAPSAEPPALTSEDEPELAAFAAAMEEEERERDDGMQGAERDAAEAMLGMAAKVVSGAGDVPVGEEEDAVNGGEGEDAAEEQVDTMLESVLEEQLDAATVSPPDAAGLPALDSSVVGTSGESEPQPQEESEQEGEEDEAAEEEDATLVTCCRCGRVWDGSALLADTNPTMRPHA